MANVETPRDIEIKIPTAFLVDQNQTTFHVYLVQIRVGSDWWSLRKRYSEFSTFHKFVREKYPQIGVTNADFPSKKALGNRGARVVQNRLCKLQNYLNLVVNRICMQYGYEIRDKATFTTLLPFFEC
ncbi:sorting nexin-29-like [Brevipalpus obovatus]|uniref:sorting nexin-29-like n=1 Tax=Brevipalpus obovatus TaxID=246614 RepID=UPI003D9F2CB8